ncbi:MAG: hypothetical protein HQM09_22790 [Candidatus Riflebacteria bacterium]|nr:hypothetical protein [Candidatus Riflebacteria bacterium]
MKGNPFDNDFLQAWSTVVKNIPLSRISSRRQYDLMVQAMEYLADLVDDDLKHSLTGLLDILEMLIEDYDRVHNQIPPISAAEGIESRPVGRKPGYVKLQIIPEGWTEKEIQDLAEHYDNQPEDEAIAEMESAKKLSQLDKSDPIHKLGQNSVKSGIKDASENTDSFLYSSKKAR